MRKGDNLLFGVHAKLAVNTSHKQFLGDPLVVGALRDEREQVALAIRKIAFACNALNDRLDGLRRILFGPWPLLARFD